MKTITEQSGCRSFTLSMDRAAAVDYLNSATAMILELPGVLRVRVNLDARQLEILYQPSVAGLLQRIHQALLAAGNEIALLRPH